MSIAIKMWFVETFSGKVFFADPDGNNDEIESWKINYNIDGR